MAMRPRGGAQVPRSQFLVRPTYEDFEPQFDEKEEPTAYMLHVYLPGFAREQLKVTYDDSAKKIKARGERPLGNYKWSRFEKEFSIPDSCIVSQIKGKFEKNILIITMPKKVITQVASQDPEANKKATKEAATASPPSPAPAEPKKMEEAMPPKATSSAPSIEKPKEDKPAAGSPSSKKATFEPKSQKGKQESPQKPTSTDKKNVEPKSPQIKPQEVEDQSPPKPTSKDKNTTEPKSPQIKPQEVEDQSPPKPTSKDKNTTEPKSPQIKPQEVKDQSPPKPTSKRTHRSVEQKPKEEEKTPEKKSKEPEMGKSGIQDPSEKKVEKSTEGPGGYASGGYQEKAESSGAKRSKEGRDMGASAKEVLGKLAKRIKEDEDSKQLLINAGVAGVVIVALGAYIAYTIGSGETKN